MIAGIPKYRDSDTRPWQIPDIWCSGDETKQSSQWWLKTVVLNVRPEPNLILFKGDSPTIISHSHSAWVCFSKHTRTRTHAGTSPSPLLRVASVCDQGRGGPALFPGCVGFIHHQRDDLRLCCVRSGVCVAFVCFCSDSDKAVLSRRLLSVSLLSLSHASWCTHYPDTRTLAFLSIWWISRWCLNRPVYLLEVPPTGDVCCSSQHQAGAALWSSG